MKNKSGNDKIGTVFIQDNLVHHDAQRVTSEYRNTDTF